MDNHTTLYTFECKETGYSFVQFPLYKDTNVSLEFDSSVRWSAVLYEFAKFLSGIYGYDIVEQITVNGYALGSDALEPIDKEALRSVMEQWEKEDNLDEEASEPNYFMGSADDWA